MIFPIWRTLILQGPHFHCPGVQEGVSRRNQPRRPNRHFQKGRAHSFSGAAVIDYQKPGGLKQHKCILLQFWKPDAQDQFHWAEIKVPGGAHFLWRLWGKIHSWPLPASGSCCHSLAWGDMTAIFKVSIFKYLCSPCSHFLLFVDSSSASPLKVYKWLYLGPTCII